MQYKVILKSKGQQILHVVKAVKFALEVDLKTAKDLVDQCPSELIITDDLSLAQSHQREIEAAGAVVEIEEVPG